MLALINAAHSSISTLESILPCSASYNRVHTKSLLETCEDEELKLDVSKVNIKTLLRGQQHQWVSDYQDSLLVKGETNAGDLH